MNPYTQRVYDLLNGAKANVGPYYKSDVHFGIGLRAACHPLQSPAAELLARYITDLVNKDLQEYKDSLRK